VIRGLKCHMINLMWWFDGCSWIVWQNARKECVYQMSFEELWMVLL